MKQRSTNRRVEIGEQYNAWHRHGHGLRRVARHMLAILTSLTVAIIATKASAVDVSDKNCGARDHVIEKLEARYGEIRHSLGLIRGDGMVEVYASPITGSWSILLSHGDGQTCLIASGTDFHEFGDPYAIKKDAKLL